MKPETSVPHGGGLSAAALKYGGNKADWLDLSTGINPVSAPLTKLDAGLWQALPDADVMQSCLDAARKFYGFQQGVSLVAAPGVQALIQLLPQLRPNTKAAVFGPTYGEYTQVFQTLGAGCRIINSIGDLQDEAVVIAVNPNNPDGRVILPDALTRLAKTLASRNGLLVVDEAFGDLTAEISVACFAGMRGLLVLKSFGKFFGLAGVRLGFAAGHANDIAILERHLGPWAVSGPALAIGAACMPNTKLTSTIAEKIRENSNQQCAVFAKLNLSIVANTGLFHLIEHHNAHALYKGLARQHVLTRIFAYNSNWLRLGLCKNNAELSRLKNALQHCLETP